ncbi:MAG: hypothetical protein LUE99_00035 [Bacteroides sp.]|nr:hypothetical protein [Bacteroides sp.]
MTNSGGTVNQLAPKNGKPKYNKLLLIINVILFFCAIALSVAGLHYKEYVTAAAMLLVMFLTAANAWACWKRLKRPK